MNPISFHHTNIPLTIGKISARPHDSKEMIPSTYSFENKTLSDLLNEAYISCCSESYFHDDVQFGILYPKLNESDKDKVHTLLKKWATMYNLSISQAYFRSIVGVLLTAISPHLPLETIEQFEPYINLLKDDYYRVCIKEADLAEEAFEKRKDELLGWP